MTIHTPRETSPFTEAPESSTRSTPLATKFLGTRKAVPLQPRRLDDVVVVHKNSDDAS